MSGVVPSAALGATAQPTAGAAAVALQSAQFDTTAEVLLQVAEFVGAVLGLFIAYQAYQGYRRNDSRPMLFIALGFVIIMGVPTLLSVPALLVPGVPLLGVQGVVQAFEIVGLLCIIHALRMEP